MASRYVGDTGLTVAAFARLHNLSHATVTSQLNTGACAWPKDIRGGMRSKHWLACTWRRMIGRCTNNTDTNYHRYGARGITIYPEWVVNFESFRDYIEINLGLRPKGFSLDRIDNDQGYKPGNLRWADRKTQANNTRRQRDKGVS